jgi:hypothetical protein
VQLNLVSQFLRGESPPDFDRHEHYRPFLRRDFRFVCAYCERPEAFLGGEEFFEVDHFRPVKWFPELRVYYPNLYYACGKCNRYKGSTWPSESQIDQGCRFADPCEEDMYARHLNEGQDGTLQVQTNTGRYTCDHIRLNRPAILEWRRERRRIVAELPILQLLRESLSSALRNATESGLQEDFVRKIEAVDSTIAQLRRCFQ